MLNAFADAPRQRGFSLVEMMVALVLGLVVTGAVLALVVAIIHSNRQTLQSTRLNQELRATLAVIASRSPSRMLATTAPVKREPTMLSKRRSWPLAIWPRACMAASRAVTPDPVGERSTSASANTQTLRVGASA